MRLLILFYDGTAGRLAHTTQGISAAFTSRLYCRYSLPNFSVRISSSDCILIQMERMPITRATKARSSPIAITAPTNATRIPEYIGFRTILYGPVLMIWWPTLTWTMLLQYLPR